jgi:hypothetical protein
MLKLLKYFLFVFMLVFVSCNTVKVVSDYDAKVDFSNYKTFAFYKPGIDKADISDLDKKRILRAIESELIAKGFTKATELVQIGFPKPEDRMLLVSIFTKSREKVNVNQNNNLSPWGWGNGNMNNINVSQYTEGTLFVDFIDKDSKELIWQGIGTATIENRSVEKREERINLVVKEILAAYPPN